MRRFGVLHPQSLREFADPRGLPAHGGVESLYALVGQHEERCQPMMMGIGFQGDQSVPLPIVDDALNMLAPLRRRSLAP